MVDIFEFSAEAGIEKSFVSSLYKVLNLIGTDSRMKTIDPLDVSQIFTEVIGRPLYILGSETGSLTDSEKVKALLSDMCVTFAFSQ